MADARAPLMYGTAVGTEVARVMCANRGRSWAPPGRPPGAPRPPRACFVAIAAMRHGRDFQTTVSGELTAEPR